MLVYLQRNYVFPDILRQTPGGKGKWNDMQFTFAKPQTCDAVVVLNHPLEDISLKCRKGNKFILIQEPPYAANNYFKLHFRFYNHIVSGFDSEHNFISHKTQAALPWHINKSFDELNALDVNQKTGDVSWVTSNNNLFPQHKVRLGFIAYLKQQSYPFALLGRGFTPIQDKFDGIYPYKYTIAAENYIGPNYFTEKIIDAFLSWTMPIYYGSPNITDYFPAESMIRVDLNDHQQALETIKEAIANRAWEKNIEAIAHARQLILQKYQLFPLLHDLISNSAGSKNEYEKIFLPASGLTTLEKYKKNVRTLFKSNK